MSKTTLIAPFITPQAEIISTETNLDKLYCFVGYTKSRNKIENVGMQAEPYEAMYNKFLKFKNGYGITQCLNINEVVSYRTNLVRTKVILQSHNSNFSKYYVYIFLHEKHHEITWSHKNPNDFYVYHEIERKTFHTLEEAQIYWGVNDMWK